MYIISTQEFIKATFISNVNETNSGISEKVNAYIDTCVPNLLKDALGTTLFTELNSNIVNGVLSNTAPQKWKDLVNGVTYTKDSKTYVWEGLLINRGLFKESLLTYYVWCEWMNDNVYQNSSSGNVISNTKNAVSVSPVPNMAKNWNSFLTMYQGCNDYATSPRVIYANNAIFYDYYNNENGTNNIVSLIQFLKDNDTNYPTANCYVFTETSRGNRFSI